MRERLLSLVFVSAMCLFGLSVQTAVATPCPDISFGPPSYFPNGLQAHGIATGDLNGDGNADLAVANEGSGMVMVRFGNGAGAFPTAIQFFTTTPSGIAIADFNRDGILDLVTSNRNISAITVRLGLGGGAFGLPAQSNGGSSPSAVATGDFNGDGNIDIVTANGGSTTITIALGNAAGAFSTATPFLLNRGSGPWGIVTADFNGDGFRDVATANRGSNNVSVVFGNGAGGFSSSVVYPAGTEPFSIATSDVNGDAKLDLAIANATSNNVTVRLNNGGGSFLSSVNLPANSGTSFVAVGDLDNDGDGDIVATNHTSNKLSVFRGNGNGTFAAKADFAVNSGPRAVLVGDLNGDGGVDIAAGVDAPSIAVFLNACSTNSPPTISASPVTRQQDGWSNSTIATVGDAEDDLDDLVVTVDGGASSSSNGVTISNINVDATGTVTADVAASCGASDATFSLTVTDTEGLFASTKLSVEVTNETTPPVINGNKPLPNITVYLPLNSAELSMPVTFDLPSATDNCSDPTVTTSPVSGSSFSIGRTTVNVTATDELGNTSSANFTVTVLFNFVGFFQPVESLPGLNIAAAGSAIPIKFSLNGDKGLNILAAGYPASSAIPCDLNEPGSTIDETQTVGDVVLTYDPLTDQYKYVWKTNRMWRDSCRMFILRLADGSEHYAKFRFR